MWLAILGFFGKISWKAIGGFIIRYWPYILVAVLIWFVWHRGNVIENLEADLKTEKQKITGFSLAIDTLDHALKNNTAAIKECEITNSKNTSEIGRLQIDLDESEAIVTALGINSDEDIERFRRETEAMRGTDTTCRTLDDNLPERFIGGVRQPSP